jgi:hypothetical protein
MLMEQFMKDEMSGIDLDDVELGDCSLNTDSTNYTGEQASAKSLSAMLKDSESGISNLNLYRAVAVAAENNIIDSDETNWNLGITKSEFIDLLVNTLMSDTSNRYDSEDENDMGNGGAKNDQSGLTEEELIAEGVDEDNSITEEDINAESTDTDTDTDKKSDTSSKSESKSKDETTNLSKENTVDYKVKKMSATKMYATTTVNIRKGPSTDYDKVGTLTYGESVTVNGKVSYNDKTWYRIKTSDGSEQFVVAQHLSTTKPAAQSSSNNSSSSSSSSGKSSSSSSNSSKGSSSSGSGSSKGSSSSSGKSSSGGSSKGGSSSSSGSSGSNKELEGHAFTTEDGGTAHYEFDLDLNDNLTGE